MGSHKEAAAVAAGVHAIVFADSATVTYAENSDDTPVEITAIVHPVRSEQRPSGSGTIMVDVRLVAVEFSEIDSPAINGIISIGDVLWSIEKVGSDSSRWLLSLTKTVFVERTRNNYRKNGR